MLALIPIEISQTASSGAWSFNTDRITGADLRQIILNPATDTTTYNFTITDDYSNIVYSDEGITGWYGPLLYLPMRGVYTIAVDTASADELFTGRLLLEA